MTQTKNYSEHREGGETYWREQYRDKEMRVYMWRYGYYCESLGQNVTMRSGLMSRPNLKKLFSDL